MPTHPQPLSPGFPNTGPASVPMESEQPQPARWGDRNRKGQAPPPRSLQSQTAMPVPKGAQGSGDRRGEPEPASPPRFKALQFPYTPLCTRALARKPGTPE